MQEYLRPPPALPPPPPLTEFDKMTVVNINDLTEYDRQKILNVKRNNEVFLKHNLPTLAIALREEFTKMKGKEKVQEGSDQDYLPQQEEHSDDETSKNPKKVCPGSELSFSFL